ncbi:hypothetical protein WN093_01160 [Gammaproteobacteria bacterium AS21]
MDSIELRKDVYAHYGAAMYYAQCLEQGIIIAIMFIDHFPKAIKGYSSQEAWESSFDKFMDNESSKTMGRLIGSLKAIDFPIERIELQLKEALKKRNFLAHHYFFERALEMTTDNGCIKLVQELEEMQSFFSSVEVEINNVSDQLAVKYGFTEEMKESIMQQMMAEHSE